MVLNKGPETVRDFLQAAALRIFAGHIYLKETLGYKVSTMNPARLAWLFLSNMKWEWQHLGSAGRHCRRRTRSLRSPDGDV